MLDFKRDFFKGEGYGKTEYTFFLALGNLVSPGADTRVTVVSQTGRALVAARLAVPAAPEDVALGVVGEDTVQTRAVRSANRRL